MKFVHLADCHIDGFRDQRLSKLGIDNFMYVLNYAIQEKVDFVLLAGDLFNTALPRIDALKEVTFQLKKLQENNIPLYIIPGSHDFSPHGRTMLDVLELAGLVINVMKGHTKNGILHLDYTTDTKTNAKITGILGKSGMLDKEYYKDLNTSTLSSNNFRIFMFHTALEELKTPKLERMEASPISLLPLGFDYYAGGHVHITKRYSDATYKNIVYPGPTFPNSFSELEELKTGTFVLYNNNTITHKQIPNKEVVSCTINANSEIPEKVFDICLQELSKKNLDNTIVLLRFEGIVDGKVGDIDMQELFRYCYSNGAYVVLKNTHALQSKLFEEIVVHQNASVEEDTIQENIGKIPFTNTDKNELESIQSLLQQLDIEQFDGEKKTTFTERLVDIARCVLESDTSQFQQSKN